MKPPRRLKFTRLGTYVVLLALGIGFAAMNTGNNLAYMVFGMMLGMITASGIISEMSLRGIEIDWIWPGELTAKEKASVRLILKNSKRKIPSVGLLAHFRDPFYFNAQNDGNQKTLKTFFPYIPPAGGRSQDVEISPQKRGEYAMPPIEIETQFPFGFFKKSMSVLPEGTLLVYPSHIPISPRNRPSRLRRAENPHPERGPGENFWGLRDFAHGDNPRRVAWKASAKRERWMVLETEQDLGSEFFLDMRPLSDWMRLTEPELEDAVSFAATYLAKNFEWGHSVGLAGPNFYSAPSNQKKALANILRYLALFDPAKIAKTAEQTEWMETPRNGVHLISLWRNQRISMGRSR